MKRLMQENKNISFTRKNEEDANEDRIYYSNPSTREIEEVVFFILFIILESHFFFHDNDAHFMFIS